MLEYACTNEGGEEVEEAQKHHNELHGDGQVDCSSELKLMDDIRSSKTKR